MTDHTDLIAALGRGETGPEIDCLIHAALHPDDTVLMSDSASTTVAEFVSRFPAAFDEWGCPDDWCDVASVIDAKPLSTSLDACQAETERMGWRLYGITSIRDGASWSAILAAPDGEHVNGHAPTAPAAWAAAILRAKGGET